MALFCLNLSSLCTRHKHLSLHTRQSSVSHTHCNLKLGHMTWKHHIPTEFYPALSSTSWATILTSDSSLDTKDSIMFPWGSARCKMYRSWLYKSHMSLAWQAILSRCCTWIEMHMRCGGPPVRDWTAFWTIYWHAGCIICHISWRRTNAKLCPSARLLAQLTKVEPARSEQSLNAATSQRTTIVASWFML